MWIRLRLDIGWNDLLAALAWCVIPDRRLKAASQAQQSWSLQDDFLIALSVRSSFDLLLRALELPCGSEVLLSALTVPDMVRIVEMHGLVPVPVDTDEMGNISITALKQSISSRSRILVVAHLFGGTMPLDDVGIIAQQHRLFLVEDCAQSFRRVGESGQQASDVAMFSFGPIKTATALGGAVVRVSSRELRNRMAVILQRDPVQSNAAFAFRVVRFGILKLLTGRLTAVLFRFIATSRGYNFDSLANASVRGFSTAELMTQIRRQPATPLLRLLVRRWQTYDFRRIDHRIQLGRRLDQLIGRRQSATHSYWVFPLFVQNPVMVRNRLRQCGFDATSEARMAVVPAIDDSRVPTFSLQHWKRVVFLPWYPELPDEAIDKMADLIRCVEVSMDGIPTSWTDGN